jgi:hypothetical protein
MKRIWLLLCSAAFAAVLAPTAHAQNYLFSSFQCDPTSCQEEGPAETQGSVLVNFNGTCTGGVLNGISGSAEITIGVPTACKTPYIPLATVETSETEYLDDCGDPYYVDYVTGTAEVISPTGGTVLNISGTSGCDGSTSGPTTIGTKPC